MPLSTRILVSIYSILALLLAAPLVAQEKLFDPVLGFTLKIPAEFKPNPELVKVNPQIAHAYIYEHPEDGIKNMMLIVETMQGTIGREHFDASKLPPHVNVKHFITKWQGYEVDGFEVPEESEGQQFLTYNIQIPLKKNAVQLKFATHASNKANLDQLLPIVLDNFQGQTNWTEPEKKPDPNNDYGKFLLVCAIVFIVAGIVLFFVISKRTNPGVVLALAVIIWILGARFGGAESREGLMMAGSLKMLGFIGIILGIVDMVRGRVVTPPPKDGLGT